MEKSIESRDCPNCGAVIPAEAPQGLCPKCLLSEASVPTGAGQEGAATAVPSVEELAAAFPQLEILELIGRGGMGFVFKARQPKLDRVVALKILPESLARDPAFAERFTREGRVLARLSHPNIVTIHDFGQANGFFYLLMEHVDGVNLRQAMRAGRFTPEQALAVVPPICEALQFAHGEGILHRDIKPENILLDSKGRIKIADFGIAKILGAKTGGAGGGAAPESAAKNATTVMGTPQYMAPEQVENPRLVDQRADIYSLGVVFYEMLTGELPMGRFAPPSEKSGVDPRLDEVVLRALEKEPERRTRTAGEFKTQVETVGQTAAPRPERLAKSEPRPEMMLPGAGRRAIRRGVQVGLAVWLVMVLVTILGILFLPKTYVGLARISVAEGLIYDPFKIQTEFERIKSAEGLRGVAESLDLASRWTEKYGRAMALEEIVPSLQNALNLQQTRNTTLVEIRFYSESPVEAAEIANAIAQNYVGEPPREGRSIIELAEVPRKAVRPNVPLNIMVGAAISVALGVLAGGLTTLLMYFVFGRVASPGASAPATSRFPRALFVVAVLFILSGVSTVWSEVSAWQPNRYSMNFGVLALPIGIGLLRCRRWWRMTALGYIWITFGTMFLAGSAFAGGLLSNGSGMHIKINSREISSVEQMGTSALILLVGGLLLLFTLLFWAHQVLMRPDVKALFKPDRFRQPWLEWSALSGVVLACILISRAMPPIIQPPAVVPVVFASSEGAANAAKGTGPLARKVAPPQAASAPDAPVPSSTKVIAIDKVIVDSDRVAFWTDSALPAGEAVVPLLENVDGSLEDAMAHRMTIRDGNGKRITTVFSWRFPDSFDPVGLPEIEAELKARREGTALRLDAGEPLVSFTLTNRAGGTIRGILEYDPTLTLQTKAVATASFSSATNLMQMVLGYFTPTVPPGHVLEALGALSGGSEAKVHTSISRSHQFNSGNIRWDFPKSFAPEAMEAAAAQVRASQGVPIQIPAGERVRLFSVTNRAGVVYEGFLELIPPGVTRTNDH